MEIKKAKALKMMESLPSIEERAKDFYTSSKREVQKRSIDIVIDHIDQIKDRIADLQNFSLEADVNKGYVQLTRQEVADRFVQIIELELELNLAEKELEIKKNSFSKYFG